MQAQQRLVVMGPIVGEALAIRMGDRQALAGALTASGWNHADWAELELDPAFIAHNEAFVRTLPVGSAAEHGAGEMARDLEITLAATGVGVFQASYDLGPASTSSQCWESYQDLKAGEVQSLFQVVVATVNKWLEDAKGEGTRTPRLSGGGVHWTHAILIRLEPEGLEDYWPEGVAFSQAGASQRVWTRFGEVEVTIGWETSAVRASSTQALGTVLKFFALMGYVWELTYAMDSDLTRRVSTIDVRPGRVGEALKAMREYRMGATTLFTVGDSARLSMGALVAGLATVVKQQWRIGDLQASIAAKAQLLEMAYAQLLDEQRHRFGQLIGVAAAILALLSAANALLGIYQATR